MIHEPAKWAGWQSTTAAAQHLDRLKQMQSQIYRLLAARSGKPLRQIIRDTKRNDFYLDAWKATEYGLLDAVLGEEEPAATQEDAEAERSSLTPEPDASPAVSEPGASPAVSEPGAPPAVSEPGAPPAVSEPGAPPAVPSPA